MCRSDRARYTINSIYVWTSQEGILTVLKYILYLCGTLDTKKRTHLDIFSHLAQIPNQWLEYWHKRQMMHDQFQNPKELLWALLSLFCYCPKKIKKCILNIQLLYFIFSKIWMIDFWKHVILVHLLWNSMYKQNIHRSAYLCFCVFE